MLYKVGTVKEIQALVRLFPEPVIRELYSCTLILDSAYGPDRNYTESGGYSLLAETAEDLHDVENVIDFETHPCEWADRLGDHLSALYLLNDDFSVVVFMPIAIAPATLLEELEESV